MRKPAKKTSTGHWIISRADNYAQWEAWRCWMLEQFGKTFWPDVATAYFEWPPETSDGAQFVADRLKSAREEVKSSVPLATEFPKPWVRWTPGEIAAAEMAERSHIAAEAAPGRHSEAAVADLIARTRQRYGRIFGKDKRLPPVEAPKALEFKASYPEAMEKMRALVQRSAEEVSP